MGSVEKTTGVAPGGTRVSPRAPQTGVRVTLENFVRAETDRYSSDIVAAGGFGRFIHLREPTPIDEQSIVRMNRDTLYSSAVFDLDAGPVTLTLPDAGTRYMMLEVLDQDHYVHDIVYAPARRVLDRDAIGTRYVVVLVRTMADPRDPADLAQARALQDAIQSAQPGGPGEFEIPNWDATSLMNVRNALKTLAAMSPNWERAFGTKSDVDPVQHLIGTAAGWGGNPRSAATYVDISPPMTDRKQVYEVTLKDVPVDGFWSISVYNADGFFEKNPWDAYSVNDVTAERNQDGSVTVRFGGCRTDGARVRNCLPTMPGWNAILRLYKPRSEVLDGRWTPPALEPVD